MDQVYREKVIDYLNSITEVGFEQFLTMYPHAVLLEKYLAPSSRIKVVTLETVSGLGSSKILSQKANSKDKAILLTRVIPVTKSEANSAERMYFVGRAPNNDIVLPNKMVSKLHAYLCQVPGSQAYQIVDMNSTNGTFINGRQLLPSLKQRLEDADTLSFGPETSLEFFSPAGFCQLLQQLG